MHFSKNIIYLGLFFICCLAGFNFKPTDPLLKKWKPSFDYTLSQMTTEARANYDALSTQAQNAIRSGTEKVHLEFKEGGVFNRIYSADDIETGTWTKSGNKLTIQTEDATTIYEIKTLTETLMILKAGNSATELAFVPVE